MARSRLLATLPLLLAGCIPAGPPPRRPVPPPPVPVAQPTPAAPVPLAIEQVGEVAMPPSQLALSRRAVVPDATITEAATYTVARGDTLRRVSDRTGAGSEAIARSNGLSPPFTIRVGQRLRIPAGRWHKVAAGQSGIAIARAYGVDWSRIVTLNDLEEPYVLRTGQRLALPTTTEVATMSVEERAAAFRLDIDDLITGAEPALAANRAPTAPVARPSAPLPATAAVAEPKNFTGRFGWPLSGPILTRFGNAGGGIASDGIIIAADRGTPVLASANGVVAYVGSEIAGLGGLILIRHGDGWTTIYGHADTILVTRGQKVTRGQTIARSGDSGAPRPQLHFQVRDGRRAVDPLRYLPARG